MKRLRLLPIVIFATAALLLFKTVGIVTGGGYVLVGAPAVQGAENESAPTSVVADAVPIAGPTLTDASPTLTDSAPTLATTPQKGGHGGDGSAAPTPGGEVPPPPSNSIAAAVGTSGSPAPHASRKSAATPAAAPADCPVLTQPIDPNAPKADMQHPLPPEKDVVDTTPGDGVVLPGDCPPPQDAQPITEDAFGNKTPLSDAEGGTFTDQQLLTRLSERRAELDAEAKKLDMRAALIEAAQKRLDQREAALKSLETKVDAQSRDGAATPARLTGLVSMYEAMRPADAATIFNNLDMKVLVAVAKSMNPRKMAPILGKMDPSRAQALTVALATGTLPGGADGNAAGAGPARQLPQIVGH